MGKGDPIATTLMDRTNPRNITKNAFGDRRFSSSLTANVETDLKKKTSSLHALPEPSITEASSVKGLSSSLSSAALRILDTTNTAGGSEHSTRLELYTTPNTTTENNNDKNDDNNSNNNKHTTTTTNNNNDERQLDATEPNRKTPSLPAVTHTIVSSDETNEDDDDNNNNNNDNNRESSAVSLPNGSKSIMEKDRESRNALGLSPQENEVSEEPIDDSSKQKIEFRQHRTILAGNSHAPSLRSDMDIDNKSGAKDSVRNAAANNNDSLNDGSSSQLQTNNNTSVVDALPRKENGGSIDTATVHNNEAASKSPVVNCTVEQTRGIGLGALQRNGEENNICKPPAKKPSQNAAHRGLRDRTNNDEILSSAGSEKHSSKNILATTADSISNKSSVSKKTNAIENKETEGEQKGDDDAPMCINNEDNEGSTSSTGSNKGNDSEIDNEEEGMGSFHNNKTDTPPSVTNRSQFSPIDTMEEPGEFPWTMMAAMTTTAVGEETAAAAPLSVAETGNEEAPPPAAVDPSITMTTRTTIKTTEKEEEAKGSRNADPPRVEQERATAQQEQPSAVLPEEEKEEGSAPSSSQPQPQKQQGKLAGKAVDLAATAAPAAAVTSTSTTTTLSGAATTMATNVPLVVTVRPSVVTNQGNNNNNTTNPPPSSATNLQAPSTTAVDPTIADVTAVLATAIDSPVTENSLMNPFVGTNEDMITIPQTQHLRVLRIYKLLLSPPSIRPFLLPSTPSVLPWEQIKIIKPIQQTHHLQVR